MYKNRSFGLLYILLNIVILDLLYICIEVIKEGNDLSYLLICFVILEIQLTKWN